MLISWPVERAAASEVFLKSAAAISAGSAIRPDGQQRLQRAPACPSGIARTFSVATIPGRIALAVIPRRDVLSGDRLHHAEQPRLRRRVRHLAAAARRARRRSRSRRSGPSGARACRGGRPGSTRKAPVRLTSMSRCHCSGVIRWAAAIVSVIAALETQMSTSSRGPAARRRRGRPVGRSPRSRSSVATSMPSPAQAPAIAAPIPRSCAGDEGARAPRHTRSCARRPARHRSLS